jgi:hypothetical protein
MPYGRPFLYQPFNFETTTKDTSLILFDPKISKFGPTVRRIGVWPGVTMDSLKFHLCPTLLCPAGKAPLQRHYGHFRGSLPVGWAASGRLLPIWTPHAVHLCAPAQKGGEERLAHKSWNPFRVDFRSHDCNFYFRHLSGNRYMAETDMKDCKSRQKD